MITGYIPANGILTRVQVNQYSDIKPEMLWLDLNNPTTQERQWIKQAYAQELQFMEELGEIEASARYYRDEFGMHAELIHRSRTRVDILLDRGVIFFFLDIAEVEHPLQDVFLTNLRALRIDYGIIGRRRLR